MADTIIGALREYFLRCPLMKDGRINVNYLPDTGVNGGMEYSIDVVPSNETLKRYINGDTLRQTLFVVRSVAEYGSDTLANIDNCGFFERLADWLEQQDDSKRYPALPPGKEATSIEAQSTAYLMSTSPLNGKYQIQCRMKYRQKG